MKTALKQLLNALDRIFDVHEELGDTAVRETLRSVIQNAFIAPKPGYQLPDEFGMFSPAGNKKVKATLAKFLAHPEVAEASNLGTPSERLAAFQDRDVVSSEGVTYDEYFGHFEPG